MTSYSHSNEPLILIVEDEAGLLALLSRAFRKAGREARGVSSGAEALEFLRENQVGLMVLDLGLPDITGQELIEALREQGRQIPFIVMSGMNDVRLTVKMMREGALDFVLKDSNFLELVVPVVQRVLEGLEVRRKFDETEVRFRQISEAISDVFWLMGPDHSHYLYVNPAFEKVWGIPASALLDDRELWGKAIVAEDRNKYLQATGELWSGEREDYNVIYRIRDAGGQLRWINDRGYARRDQSGQLIRFIGVATDVSDQKALEGQVLEATENERIRIGQDIHDDLCQRLAALKLKCSLIQASVSGSPEKQKELLAEASSDLQQATTLARGIAKGLSPVSLEAEGLMHALGELAEVTASRFGISCHFDCPDPVSVPNSTVATHLFRIAQELVNNAAKHAGPKEIQIGLHEHEGGIQLEVSNDGMPFQKSESSRRGMGLHFIQFRADSIGAGLSFIPGEIPEGGTRALCTLANL
ncbi:hybrid sensor histidine kinase/response regulator [Roseibacillus persicicus]|uniref:hybrid sensor histidine kinase/response regulator n=1 Tax=Roseibacillus persicicus TaxID=454148 RepID=UPI0028107273|nr:response regulator [Roseibacillus persicicus]MDQ8188989.1 response regulator [Roseibacillus persicicus]